MSIPRKYTFCRVAILLQSKEIFKCTRGILILACLSSKQIKMTRIKFYSIAVLFSMIFGFSAAAQQKKMTAQFSVLPGLSTNGDSAAVYTNNLSFNLFGGVNGGVKGFELGAFVNIINQDVEGMQIAGIANVVQGKSRALQTAGIVNVNKRNFDGMQVAGIVNIADSNVIGMQAAGIFNVTNNIYGMQITGISSTAKNMYGMQVSGLGGIADTITGLQVSGIINTSKSVTGMQVAGLVNKTGTLKGVQLGFINISEKVKGGVPIGFISFSRYGYKAIDVSYNEIFPATLSLKTGVNAFYNIFTGSSNFDEKEHLWSVGYGFGSRFNMTKHSFIEFEAIASQLSKNQFEEEWNILGRFNMNFAVELGGFAEIYAGPSLNVYATQVFNADTKTFGYDIAPANVFYSELFLDLDKPTYVQAWVGAQVGIRF